MLASLPDLLCLFNVLGTMELPLPNQCVEVLKSPTVSLKSSIHSTNLFFLSQLCYEQSIYEGIVTFCGYGYKNLILLERC